MPKLQLKNLQLMATLTLREALASWVSRALAPLGNPRLVGDVKSAGRYLTTHAAGETLGIRIPCLE